ncbi:MAG: cob(I)yrinic acid a,c-diamide adenosyltransferase, partial [Bacteroidales bacterium]|nr:cob(I)yrinic acid a,c-diamide adenosyltransferase [Bacteroidales bacterium]
MKIYTRGGDDGSTSLMGGRRLPKYDIRIESYGTVDELIAWLGVIREREELVEFSNDLIYLQGQLMCAAATLATDPSNPPARPVLPEEKSIKLLETLIDRMEESLPGLTSFVLPGGNQTASFCHVARCVCRRAERAVVRLAVNEDIPPIVTRLLNRTSDFLFVIARYSLYKSGNEDIK